MLFFFFFKQKTAYEMRISDWSSDVCSSDLRVRRIELLPVVLQLLWRGGGGMNEFAATGFEVPLHRSLPDPILMGGAPRSVAIANGTLAAAMGLGLQLVIPGIALCLLGNSLAVWGVRVDPHLLSVLAHP